MAAVKRLNTSYTIDSTDVIITGNLTVNGTQTAIESTNTVLKDRIIVLNHGETGAGVTLDDSGIEVARGVLPNVALIWHEPTSTWAFTNSNIANAASYLAIVGSSTGLTHVIDDVAPVLGANLNTSSYTISSNVGNVKFAGNLQLKYTTIPAVATTGTIVVNAAEEGAGRTGLYVTGDASTNEELITKKRAFAFSLIL
jgi:hypothetical protein